jgi:hypothetical protein
MRIRLGIVACLSGFASLALAAPGAGAPEPPTYHLHGYYKLHDQIGIWEASDDSPWQVAKGESWVDSRLVKWGYVPITHDAGRYYCLINDHPPTGTHVGKRTFICGDPDTVEILFNNHQTPRLPIYGGD